VDEFVLGDRAMARRLFDPEVVRRLVAEHVGGRAEHGDRLWLLIGLEIWQRVFLDGEHSADVMRPVEKTSGVSYPHVAGNQGSQHDELCAVNT
jgi:hypothetical protein